MDNASERYAQQMEMARQAVARGDRSAAVEALRAAVDISRGFPILHREHTTALVRLGTLEQELGRPVEAERLFTEAIAIGERRLGPEHASLGVALNELGRLHIRQSEFARAEPILKRLLRLKRAKGDRHPDVATALAGLAVAKRGLGDDASAERLYRHALRIREEVLAPDHMATVITLEQLSKTCASRGNFAEALALLERALPKRERALGVDHATVRALRARMADLERCIPKPIAPETDAPAEPHTPTIELAPAFVMPPVVVEAPTSPPPSPARASADWRATPARPRALASIDTELQRTNELVFLYQPEPRAPRTSRPTAATMAAAAPSVVAVSPLADAPVKPVHTQSVALVRSVPVAQGAALVSPPASAISRVPVSADAPMIGASSRDIVALFSSMKRTTLYTSAGAAVIALALVGSDFGASGPDLIERAPSSVAVRSHAAVVTPALVATSQTSVGAPASLAAPSGAAPAPVSSVPQPARVNESGPDMPSVSAAVPSLRKLVVPRVAMPSLDSLMGTGSKIGRDIGSEPVGTASGFLASARNDDVSVTPPVLISAPTPRFPDELRAQRVDGEVVVQFRVNDKGRVDVSTMQVVQSGHELFTAAVRSVLPKFRFEPAHSTAAGSKPQSAWVQFRAQFTARN